MTDAANPRIRNLPLFHYLFFFCYLFLDPPGHTNTTETLHTFDGWRVGRNPPSVPSSICLIGEPAPPAEDHRRLHPLSQRSRGPFHPASSPPSGTPGRTSHHRHTVPAGYRFCAPTQALARHVTCYASAMWVEFPQNNAVLSTLFCDCSPTRHPNRKNMGPANRLIRTSTQNNHERCRADSASDIDIAPNVGSTRDQHLGRLGIAG